MEDWIGEGGIDLRTAPRIPVTRVHRYIAELLAEDEHEDIHRAWRVLLNLGTPEVDSKALLAELREECNSEPE